MNIDNELLDEISRFGSNGTSLFVDDKGHQGDIIIETGLLLWLKSIYNVDLSTNTYKTGFNTILHEIANSIYSNHNNEYNN
mgnify:CR=1 FL=1